ncbi:MAG: hypothetical protein ABGX43_05645, partial [Nitrospinaceae bacterium]
TSTTTTTTTTTSEATKAADIDFIDDENEVEADDEMNSTILLLRKKLRKIDQYANLDPILLKMFNETINAQGTKEEVLTLLLSMVNKLQRHVEQQSSTAMPITTTTTDTDQTTVQQTPECANIEAFKVLPGDSVNVVRKKQGNLD